MIDKTESNINIQHLLLQLNNLYKSQGTYGMYDLVYDQLKLDGHTIKYSKELTNQYWQKAKKKFAAENKRLIGVWTEDKLKELLNKYMKTILASKYVMDKLTNEDITMVLKDDVTGEEIKFLNIVGYDNDKKQ